MQAKFELTNTGDRAAIEVLLQVSWSAGSESAPQIRAKELAIAVKRGEAVVQSVDFGSDARPDSELLVIVKRANGGILTQRSLVLAQVVGTTVALAFAADEEIDPDADPGAPGEPPRPTLAYGRLLDKHGVHPMDGVQIIISAKREGHSDVDVLTAVTTEAQGYFSIDYPLGNFTEASAYVGLDLVVNPLPIRLEPDPNAVVIEGEPHLVFPRNVILVAELPASVPAPTAANDCDCKATEFGEKRVLEEFSFFSLVRTSEPAIQGFVLTDEDEITLGEVLHKLPFSVFELLEPIKSLPFVARPSPLGLVRASAVGRAAVAAPAPNPDDAFQHALQAVKLRKSVLTDFLRSEKSITKENIAKLFALNEAAELDRSLSIKTAPGPRPLGRVVLGATAAVDWDDQPTLYQAVEVAHGHLLQFKSEWIADGYSLGDLLYSLPLAPGQKKQIVVFDWERRESAVNEQSVDFNESLQSTLGRDRDILEIAKGTVNENVRGSSRSTTASASAGLGGILGGVLFGVSGGFGTSSSRASQDSFRQVSSSDSQRLRDRIVQSANAVRSLRSTVIQTVSQGERFEVSSESVANYNHCHALTIQYYEVLRHFKVRQRFADAREVLFVPLLMSSFDARKVVRWRDPLKRALLEASLAPGFDATDRVLHQWENSGFPAGTFASESIVTAAGVLEIRFVLQRPLDEIVEVDDTDRPPVFSGSNVAPPVWHKKKVARIIPANWAKLKPLLDGVSPEEFHHDYLENATDKDGVFHSMLGEKIARAFVGSLVFTVEDANGNSVGTVPIDASLTSRYARNGMLRVTMRLNQPTSFARDKFFYLRIKTRVLSLPGPDVNLGDVLPEGSYMTVESASMRYKTAHYDGFLFRYQTLGDDLTATDGATIYAGPSSDELKDPRREDIALVNRLIAHLNDHLEHYHKALWLDMTPERRFLLLDGIILDGKGEGRSVASLVENELLAVVGNSLVFPVAPGLNLNPDFGLKQSLTEFYMTVSPDPVSVAVPTKGVFAEAAMGKCNACEKIDDSRFWRWEESPIPDSPTAIAPINTDSRRADPGNLQPQAMPAPIVAFQNAPAAPDPTGLAATLGLLGQSGVFKDITGLEGNQRNALAALQSTLSTAQAFGQEAAKLEVQKMMERRLDKALAAIDGDSSLSPEKKAELKEKALSAYMGAGATKEEPKKDPNHTKFEEGVKMIDALEKAGVLPPEQAKELKKKLENTLLDSSSTGKPKSVQDEQSLIDTVSRTGVTYVSEKPNGERTEIRGQSDALRISFPNTSLARTFHPENHDISGETEVSVTVSNAPADAVFEWNVLDPDRVTIVSPAASTTKLRAGKPGITTLGFKVFDSTKTTVLQLVSMKVGVPQFFVVRESTINYATSDGGRNITNGTLFDTILDQLQLTADKNEILEEVHDLVNYSLCGNMNGALLGYNVRLIWQIGPYNDTIPAQLVNPEQKATPDDWDVLYTNVFIAGFPKAGGGALYGETIPPPGQWNGPDTPNELIMIYPGLIEMHRLTITPDPGLCEEAVRLGEHLQAIVKAYVADPTNADLKDIMKMVFARMIANTIMHEVYHSLMDVSRDASGNVTEPDLDAGGHTVASATVKRDIMATCRDLVDRTAFQLVRPADFPAEGSYKPVEPFDKILRLNLKNDERVSRNFPLPPTPPFGS